MHTVIAEIFAHDAARIGRNILQRCRLRGGGGYDDRVVESTVILQSLDNLGHGRALLTDRDIDAIELAGFVGAGVDLLLIEYGVDDHRGLPGLAVADDQLALPAPDRHERVDGLEPGLHRFVHRTARDNARRLDLNPRALDIGQRALSVDRLAECGDAAPEQAPSHGHVDNGAGALDDVAFMDAAVLTEHDHPDIVAFEVERHSAHPVRKRDHLTSLNRVQAIDTGDAIADRQHLANLGDIGLAAEMGDLLFKDRRNLRRTNFHPSSFNLLREFVGLSWPGLSGHPRLLPQATKTWITG